MSRKSIINAFNKIKEATNMKNRGGVVFCKSGEEEFLAFFGEHDKIRTCINIVSYMPMCNFDLKGISVPDLLYSDVIDNIEMLKEKKKANDKPVISVRNEFAFKDNFEELVESIHDDIEPMGENDCFIYCLMNGNKVCVSSAEAALNVGLYNRIVNLGEGSAVESAFNLLYGSILAIVGNYLSMHTSLSEDDINNFFSELRTQHAFIMSRMVMPHCEMPYTSGSELIQ